MTRKKTDAWSRKRIDDEFSDAVKQDGTPLSRQQKHMLRKRARGICLTCGEKAVGSYCLKHTVYVRERMRKKKGYTRRLYHSPSYVLEKLAKQRSRLKKV